MTSEPRPTFTGSNKKKSVIVKQTQIFIPRHFFRVHFLFHGISGLNDGKGIRLFKDLHLHKQSKSSGYTNLNRTPIVVITLRVLSFLYEGL